MPATEDVRADFTAATSPYRRELLAHCYRMVGSLHEAEDLTQETMLRAWRSYRSYDRERASMRTWLHAIATSVCLTELQRRARRPLPSGLSGPSDGSDSPGFGRRADIAWLQPIPDAVLGGEFGDPAAVIAGRDSIRLAFIAALQHLPARQRAVLILRDVLAWPAAEVAVMLETSAAAVNSALQRARAQLARIAPVHDDLTEPADPGRREILGRYVEAFENGDAGTLAGLLREDAVFEMPPYLSWYSGRPSIAGFFSWLFSVRDPGVYRLRPTAANGQAAFAMYRRADDGQYRAFALHALTITTGRISRIDAFADPALFGPFGLPPALGPVSGPGRARGG